MATTNILQQVQLFLRANLALLSNQSPLIATANTKFSNFDKMQYNLGSSVTFDLPPRMSSVASLVAVINPANQRAHTLVVDQQFSTSYAFTAQERIFNVDKDVDSYMAVFGKSAVAELGSLIESIVAQTADSSVPVRNADGSPTGALHVENGPFAFFGDGTTPINSFTQLASLIANVKNVGADKYGIKVYLPDIVVPPIVGTGLNQFALKRNDEIARSWEIGEFGTPPVKYYSSNLLPTHFSGTVGKLGQTLTVISTNDPTGANITQITFSGANVSDANAVKSGDLFQFVNGVTGRTDVKRMTFIGHVVSAQPGQFRAIADAASDGAGHVIINLVAASQGLGLQSQAGATQNINTNIIAGMKVTSPGDHICGLVVVADALMIAMPKLPTQDPFASSSEYDPDTAVGLRMTYGSVLGQNQTIMIHDGIMGVALPPEDCWRIVFPITNVNP